MANKFKKGFVAEYKSKKQQKAEENRIKQKHHITPVINPKDDMPKTGDASPSAAALILLASLSSALFLAMKRRKDEDAA